MDTMALLKSPFLTNVTVKSHDYIVAPNFEKDILIIKETRATLFFPRVPRVQMTEYGHPKISSTLQGRN